MCFPATRLALKNVFDFVEKATRLLFRIFAFKLGKFAQEFFLAFIETLRNHDLRDANLVAAIAAANRETFVADFELDRKSVV